jgi:hypothetical protein
MELRTTLRMRRHKITTGGRSPQLMRSANYRTSATEVQGRQDVRRGASLYSYSVRTRGAGNTRTCRPRPAGWSCGPQLFFRVLSCTATTTMNSDSQIVLQGGSAWRGISVCLHEHKTRLQRRRRLNNFCIPIRDVRWLSETTFFFFGLSARPMVVDCVMAVITHKYVTVERRPNASSHNMDCESPFRIVFSNPKS